MRFLLTNDDGIFAEGLEALRTEFQNAGHEVMVVAPALQQSAQSHSITLYHPLVLRTVELPGGGKGLAVEGTPADCVKIGLHEISPVQPDACISGINNGSNTGLNIFYSGTVGGAFEAALHDIPSFAISLDAKVAQDYGPSARMARRIVEQLMPRAGARTLFNVNIPNLPEEEVKGVRLCRQDVLPYQDAFERRTDPRGRIYFWLKEEILHPDANAPRNGHAAFPPDQPTLRQGFVTVTPIQLEVSDYELLKSLDGVALDHRPSAATVRRAASRRTSLR